MPRMRLPQSVIVKSPWLLPMHYKVNELAETLGIPQRTLRDWLVAGAPHVRDHRDNLWISGKEFADWVEGLRKKRKHKKLQQGEAYCVRCNQVVTMIDVSTHAKQGKLVMISGKCPHCGRHIWRGDRIPTSPANHMTTRDLDNES